MRSKVTPMYNGMIVEVEHDLFSDGLKGMTMQEALAFANGLDKLSADIRIAVTKLNEKSSQ